MPKEAIIIGAGPAGLTAAYELLTRTDIKPVVYELDDIVGGLSRTVRYKGNRMDLGGHRFFSKSDRVMDWWLKVLPLERLDDVENTIAYQGKQREIRGGDGPDPEEVDRVMLLRSRKSRIYFLRQFFDYPLSLSPETLLNLGLGRAARIVTSYLRSATFPIRNEENLEQFFINRFGRALYWTFFKDYTEKVWGRPCHEIDAAWGAQRIKGLSIARAVRDVVRRLRSSREELAQKETETSLIQQFLYPKHGPGHLWETVADDVRQRGGEIHFHKRVVGMDVNGARIRSVRIRDAQTGEEETVSGEWVFSTMPVRELLHAMDDAVPPEVLAVGDGLIYRDFMTVGLLVKRLTLEGHGRIEDNWIYVQERDVKLGRIQIFNNWSPYLVADADTVWLGLEYFCDEGDELWSMDDSAFARFAINELASIEVVDPRDVLDHTVERVKKTYPAYFGTYDRFGEIRAFVDGIDNLFLIGRNGMHRYNNQDHSMLAAMTAVDNIVSGVRDRANLWEINTEMEYHEEHREPGFTGYPPNPDDEELAVSAPA